MADTKTTLSPFPWSAPYCIPREFYREGFTAFQKKYVLRRSYVMMALFALLFVTFVISAVNDPSNRLSYFLMVLCLAAIFMLWYNPRKQRRMVLEAVRELEGTAYTACCDGNVLRICIQQSEDETERIPESRIMLASADVQEFDQFYLVCDGKRMFYILPKTALERPALPQTDAEKAEDTPERNE